VDIGGSAIKAGLVTSRGKVRKKIVIPFRTKTRAELKTAFLRLKNWAGVVSACGIGMPGWVDSSKGLISGGSHVPALKGFKPDLACPLYRDNDGNAAARGEKLFGVANRAQNFVFITIGTGIGCGVYVDGRLYRGQGGAGELGHMVIRKDGRRCRCGRYGCFEEYASARALLRYFPSESPAEVMILIRKKDRRALSHFRPWIANLATGLGNLINLFHPEMLIIGGGFSHFGRPLLSSLKKSLAGETWPKYLAKTRICIAKQHNDAGIIGAAALAMP